MQELISITTGEQGSPVVKSARELYDFLGVKSKFADWFKNRVRKYGFVENVDYTAVSKNLENGGRELDYALTLDMAKELSMVERTDKGKQARQYFIEAEKALQQTITNPPVLPTAEQAMLQLMSQQMQLLSDNQQMIAQLRADVDQIMHGQKRPPRPGPGKQLNLPGIHPPSARRGNLSNGANLRSMIHQRVVEYCSYHEATTQVTYHFLYKRMLDVYRVDVYRLSRAGTDSILDAVERYGHLDRLYSLVMAELIYLEDQ